MPIFDRKQLKTSLEPLARIAPKDTLSNWLRLEVFENKVIFTQRSSCLRNLYSSQYFIEVGEVGFTCFVDCKKLLDLIKSSTEKEVSIVLQESEEKLLIDGFPIAVYERGSESLEVPHGEHVGLAEMAADELVKALSVTVPFCSRNPQKGSLTYLLFDKGCTVSTDGDRLSIADLRCDFRFAPRFAINTEAAKELARQVKKYKRDVSCLVSEDSVCFLWDRFSLEVLKFEEEYPDYEKALPADFKLVLTAERKTFFEKLTTLKKVYGKNKNDTVSLLFDKGDLYVLSNRDNEEPAPFFQLPYEGVESYSITFRADYLLDFLKVGLGEFVTFKFNENTSPAVLESGFYHLLMPVKSNLKYSLQVREGQKEFIPTYDN